MSKRAEKAALKAYPKEIRDKSGFVIDIGHPQGIRDYYIEGYEQAEKDLALTPEDVVVLVNLYEYGRENGWTADDVSKHFNEKRKEK